MRRIYAVLSKGIGFIYVFLLYHLRKKEKTNNGKVLIIVSGHLGNALMDMRAIYDLKRYYVAKEKTVYIMTSSVIWMLMNKCFDFSDTIFATDKFLYNKKEALYFKNIRRLFLSLREIRYEVIVPNLAGGYLVDYIEAALCANEKWGVFSKNERNDIRTYFRRAYTNKVIVDENMHESQRLKVLLNRIGVEGHKVEIVPIPRFEVKNIGSEKYITLALDSMSTERRWPIDNFVELSQYILSHTDCDVILTGSKISKEDELKLSEIKSNRRVKDYIGKTTIEEWIELLRRSSLHVSVDSGSVHFAASVGTPCICLSGVWDGTRCMPYELDCENSETYNPLCLYQDDYLAKTEKCYGCRMRYGWYGVGNTDCRDDVTKGNPCHCLSNITVKKVAECLDTILNKKLDTE